MLSPISEDLPETATPVGNLETKTQSQSLSLDQKSPLTDQKERSYTDEQGGVSEAAVMPTSCTRCPSHDEMGGPGIVSSTASKKGENSTICTGDDDEQGRMGDVNEDENVNEGMTSATSSIVAQVPHDPSPMKVGFRRLSVDMDKLKNNIGELAKPSRSASRTVPAGFEGAPGEIVVNLNPKSRNVARRAARKDISSNITRRSTVTNTCNTQTSQPDLARSRTVSLERGWEADLLASTTPDQIMLPGLPRRNSATPGLLRRGSATEILISSQRSSSSIVKKLRLNKKRESSSREMLSPASPTELDKSDTEQKPGKLDRVESAILLAGRLNQKRHSTA